MGRIALPVSTARSNFADLLAEVQMYGERVVLERHGKAVAALVSVADLERLELLGPAGGAPGGD